MGGAVWPVRLTHGPVTLRPLRRSDQAAWLSIRELNPEWFRRWDSTRPPGLGAPSPTFPQMVADFARRARDGQMLPWAVEYADPSGLRQFVGQVTVSGITMGSARWAEVGYWIGPRWAGRGIIPTAVAMACDFCFNALGLHRIEIAIRPENTNSLAVVRKLGFALEGRRLRYMHVDGDWRDHDVFVLNREDVHSGVLAGYERRQRNRSGHDQD